jgi:hypothetical protein
VDPVTKKHLIYWGLGGGYVLLGFFWNVYSLYTNKP